ncbi:MAG: DUF167 domain-containing protein [Chloroflexi bacterium]|nr:DUF167 domain-containing protein [Chloroflexota bacterium]
MSRVVGRHDGIRIQVRVTPRAGRDEVVEVRDRMLIVRVAAPPVDGAANAAVSAVIAEALGISRSSVQVVAGQSGRRKVVMVEGLERTGIAARWPGLGV